MATTSPPKPHNSIPQTFSWKLLTAFVMWIVLTLGLIAAVYVQSAQNSYQINYLMSEMKQRESAQNGLSALSKDNDIRFRKELQQHERMTARYIDRLQTDLNNYQDFMRQSMVKQDEFSFHLNRLSEKFDKKDKELNGQENLQALQIQVEQMKDSFHSYIKSQDFFQIVNNMMDVYSKKFNQIYQELDENNEIIQKLLETSQIRNDLQPQEPIIKRESLSVEDILSDQSKEIPETLTREQEEESFIHQVEGSIEELKDKISHSVEETIEKMKDLTTSAQEKLEPVKDLIVHSAGDSMNKVKELAHSTQEKLKDLIGTQSESPFEKVKEFAKSTGENFGAIKDFVVANAGQSAEKIKEISKTAKEKIGPLKEAVNEQAQHVKESVQKIGKNLEEKTKEIAEKAKNFAKRFF